MGKAHGPATGVRSGRHVRNVNREFQETLTTGQKVADWVAQKVGSWPFIIFQTALIAVWIGINSYLVFMAATQPEYFLAWDPYPFILLNLVLSFQAAYTGPVVMMSQNRQAEKDRLMAEHDYYVNIKAEEEIEIILQQMAYQEGLLQEVIARLDAIQGEGGGKAEK